MWNSENHAVCRIFVTPAMYTLNWSCTCFGYATGRLDPDDFVRAMRRWSSGGASLLHWR